MTKEELIGRKFILPRTDGYYIIRDVDDSFIWYNYSELLDAIPTKLGKGFFEEQLEKDWKLIEDKPKMYKTSKGIEYGVGTQFKNTKVSPYSGNFRVDEVSNKYNLIKYTRLDTKSEYSIDIYEFNKNLDTNWWAITDNTTMKDYKQVDPKTIKFDFTSTKIKVNNEDESRWFLEVAKANGFTARGRDNHKHLCFYIWADKDICWAHDLNEDSDAKYKEITIQDILNNMKEVIEVGDTVCLKNYPNEDTYEVTGFDGTRVHLINLGTWVGSIKGEKGHNHIDGLKLVSKGKKKEIIAYETVVDLPGIPKGSKFDYPKFKANQDGKYYLNGNVTSKYYELPELQDTKFFKPIYKQDAIDLKFSKYTATLSKDNGLVFTDNEKLAYKDVKDILTQLTRSNTKALDSKGGYDIKIEFDIVNIKVGCKVFNAKDIQLIKDTIKELE